jgi:hypothetical protein
VQIGENGEGLVKMRRRGAKNGDVFGMVSVRAVREIKAGDIHAGA